MVWTCYGSVLLRCVVEMHWIAFQWYSMPSYVSVPKPLQFAPESRCKVRKHSDKNLRKTVDMAGNKMTLLLILKSRLKSITSKFLVFSPVQFSFLVALLSWEILISCLEWPDYFLKTSCFSKRLFLSLVVLIPCSGRFVCMSSSIDSQRTPHSDSSALAQMHKPASSWC